MGLDLGTPSGLDLEFQDAAARTRESAENAIQAALRCRQRRISFNTAAFDAAAAAALCTELQAKYPDLREIVPSRVDDSATAYLFKAPGPARKFLGSLARGEI